MSRFLLPVVLLLAGAARAAPATYDLDDSKTELLALIGAGGFPGASHPHVVVATKVVGKIVYDAEAPEKSTVTVTLPTDGLQNDDPELRKREGMKPLSDNQREGVRNNMHGDDQLNPKLFPTISFQSTAVKATGDGQLEVTGKMSIRGYEKEVNVPVAIAVKGNELVGTGQLQISHTEFHFKPYSAALGAVKNQDGITLKLKLVGRKKGADEKLGDAR